MNLDVTIFVFKRVLEACSRESCYEQRVIVAQHETQPVPARSMYEAAWIIEAARNGAAKRIFAADV